MNLRNMNIAPRALLGFSLIGTLMLILGIYALVQMNKIHQVGQSIATSDMPSLVGLNNFSYFNQRQRVLSYQLRDEPDPDAKARIFSELQSLEESTHKAMADYIALISSAQEQASYEQLSREQAQYRTLEAQLIQLARNDQQDELKRLQAGPLSVVSRNISATIESMLDINSKQSALANRQSTENYATTFNFTVALLIIATALTILCAWLLTNSITRPISQALQAAETIASGDLTRPINVEGRDEAARLLLAMQSMQNTLRDTLQHIAGSATQLACAAEELNSVTDESARGLTQQNNEIQQAATAVTEMTSAVEEVARNAVSTSQASKSAADSAGDGRDLVQETVTAIESMGSDVQTTAELIGNLAKESQDIGKVLDVIRGLADQTNLLALNAAIEAARAGEAGRGFAVVADEVRALAHRTQQSTSEIEHMIGSIQGGTEHAVSSMRQCTERAESTLNIARGAGISLETINGAVIEINERNLVIASAAEEQAQVAREVDRNLININDLSVQSASGASQTSLASNDLARLAIDLNAMVARFSL